MKLILAILFLCGSFSYAESKNYLRAKSIDEECKSHFPDKSGFSSDMAKYLNCTSLYSECAKDINVAPKNTKESKKQYECIAEVTQRSMKKEQDERQNSQNEESLRLQRQQIEIQRQQLEVQQQQQRMQNFQTFQNMQANPIFKTTPITPYYMPTRTSTQTNCYTNGAYTNCTSQ